MIWALVLTLATGPVSNDHVIDRFRNVGDCVAALQRLRPTHYYETHVTFECRRKK